MSNFKITFSNPWLLLLLIPAIVFTLLPYFLMSRKYRRTRNRIVSMILHALVMLLAIFVLSGMLFTYELPNLENEVILLVDTSYSGEASEQSRNEFIRGVIAQNGSGGKIGIVTFGYDQVLAAELSTDTGKVYDEYLSAPRPDDSATDFASALKYARSLFSYPESAKIVVVSDGLETDGQAENIIRSIAADGVRVDTAYFPGAYTDEMEILSVETPDRNILVNDSFDLEVKIVSSVGGAATLTFYDQEEEISVLPLELQSGEQTVTIEHTFQIPDLHRLRFVLSPTEGGDTLEQNNEYYTYLYLDVFNKVLLIERYEDEALPLQELLQQHGNETSIVNITNPDEVPKTVNELLSYDQVVLVNIANADMPIGQCFDEFGNTVNFDYILQQYVVQYGGGLFTVGGNRRTSGGDVLYAPDGNPVANAYNHDDMSDRQYSSIYRDLLPVEAIDFTPPVAVVFIIDRSDSMQEYLSGAKEAAIACVRNSFSERDYCGIMTLEDSYEEQIAISPISQMNRIIQAIDKIEAGGGTVYSGAIRSAGISLLAVPNVEHRHIILITDCEPSDSFAEYSEAVTQNAARGITFSVINVGGGGSSAANVRTAVEEIGNGRYYTATNAAEISEAVKEELSVPEIKSVDLNEPFIPRIASYNSIVNGISQEDMPRLLGYYGTKVKTNVDEKPTVVLAGEYVPIYAQWKRGAGMVGSFMCDLSGVWSQEFMSSPTGAQIIGNIIRALFPTENIHPNEIDAELTEDNYDSVLSIFTELEENQTIEVSVAGPIDPETGEEYQKSDLYGPLEYSRVHIQTRIPGIYTVTIRKLDGEGNIVEGQYGRQEVKFYKAFSYSEEYQLFHEEGEGEAFLLSLAERGGGEAVTEAWQIFDDFERTVKREFDPRWTFLIIAIVLFLLDIAVRKFKFKWIHELVRDHRAKQRLLHVKSH